MRSLHARVRHGGALGAALGVLALGGGTALAGTYYVAPCGDDGWTGLDPECLPPDGPKATIQAAIGAARDEDEIAVLPGTYLENIDLLGKAIRLYGIDGPTVTTIDAEGRTVSVVRCVNGEGPDSVLEGFTLRGGSGTPEGPHLYGGGMYIFQAGPTVMDCVFTENFASRGGGICNRNASPTVTRCRFESNQPGRGGGICNIEDSHPSITECIFEFNTSFGPGGAIANVDSGGIVVNCTFYGNYAHYSRGGAIYVENGEAVVVNCTFRENESGPRDGPGNDPDGGAIANLSGRVTIINSVLTLNKAWSGNGGAVYNRLGDVTIVNSTFATNEGEAAGGALFNEAGTATVTNSIFWDDTGGEIVNLFGGTTTVTYSDVQGGHAGTGNIDADPKCVDPARGNVRLRPGSPCIDAAAVNAIPPDRFDLDGDADTSERLPLDPDGNPRFADDPATEDTGCGAPAQVDMGAYEFEGDWVHPVHRGDVDGDADVDFEDLLLVLAAWGERGVDCSVADIDFSWDVGLDDLLILLANWS